MSRIILDTNDTISIGAGSSDTSIYGGSGSEKVIVAATAGSIYVDQSVERTELSGASTSYSYLISGNNLLVKSGATTVATIIGGNGTKTIAFSDGSAPFAVTGVGLATLGGQSISASTAGTLTIPATQLNTSDKSASAPVAATPIPSEGQTFTLTTGSDNLVGTAGNDTFNATNTAGTAAAQTFTLDDVLDGGLGTDILNATVGATNTYQMSNVSNIETIKGTFTAAGTLSLLGSSGITSVQSYGSTANAAFTNIPSTSVALGLASTTEQASFAFVASAVSGTADSATLNLSNVAHATTNGTEVITIAGIETLNIVSSNAANVVDTLTTTSATKYVVTGNQDLTIGATIDAATATVDASAFTGGLTLKSDTTLASSITGGAGNDSFTMTGSNAVNDSINAGQGNDTVTFAANLATTDTVNGGDGTDTLVITTALANAYVKPSTATITNFETVQLSDALANGFTVANVQAGITTVNLKAGSGVQAVTLEAGSKTIRIGAANTGTLTVNDTGTAITDDLTIVNNIAAGSMFGAAAGGLTVAGFETVTLNGTGTGAATAQAAAAISITADTGGTATLKLVGSNTFSTTALTANVIDASGLTGSAKLTMVGTTTGETSIKGSANIDTLIGSATATSIDGGAGNDIITGGAGNDTIVGGIGDDSITSAAGNDSITAGEGNDTLVFGANLATGDVIDGNEGTDTLSITQASITAIAGYSISAASNLNTAISNVERVNLTDAFDLNATFDMARLDSINYITLTAGTNSAEELSGLVANSTIVVGDASTLTATLADATGTADVINFALTDLDGTPSIETYAALTTSGIETVNIAVNEATASSTVYVTTVNALTATGATAVNVSGTESLTVTNATSLKNVDASGLTAGTLSISVANASTNATVIGGAGADTITGSTNNDTLTGNAGADSINGGAGNDTIDGGAGDDAMLAGGTGIDSIIGGEGADSLVGGDGNDIINLTETTATSDKVYIGSTDTASTDLAIGAANIDTINGFKAGTSGDILAFDIGTVAVTNHTTPKIAKLSADGVTLTSLANSATAGDTDIVIVLGDYGSYAAVQATLNLSANAITDSINGAVVVWTNGDGNTQVYYDNNISAGGGTGTQMAILTGVSTANLVAGNFDIFA